MSLEKFEASEAWRANFKKFLFVERKPAVKKTITTVETHRYSLDVSEDLQKLLNERKKCSGLEKPQCSQSRKAESGEDIIENIMSQHTATVDDTFCGISKQNDEKFSDESFEALERMCNKTASDPDSTLFQYLRSENKDEKVSDESFEALERMCDKTASDPDSTLFQYLHSENKEIILADAKKRSTNVNGSDCADFDIHNRNQLLAKFGDCTLLDDVEAPSRLWENTIAVDSAFRTSPIKMVGLMRPSTILEEPVDETTHSDVSSQASFQTASAKGLLSDVSSAYDTAHESTVTSAHSDMSNQRKGEIEIDVDEILMLAIDKSRNTTLTSQMPSRIDFSDANSPKRNIANNDRKSSDDVITSVDLIDLEETLGPQENANCSTPEIVVIDEDEREINESGETDDDEGDISIIDILSDEEDEQEETSRSRICIKLEENPKEYSLSNDPFQENKENYTFESSERSIKFNDTMEEVEYLLKKGMEYMAAKENIVEQSERSKLPTLSEPEISKTQPNSPRVTGNSKILTANSESKKKFTSSSTFIKTPNKNVQAPSNRFALDMRPFPKLDIFGKSPKTAVGHPRQKELSNNKQQFAHIVSPVGTYMKKTASTPLMSTGKMKNKNSNILNATAFRELEYESRLCQPKIGTNPSEQSNLNYSGLATLPGCVGVQKILPKKAYISSELKHIVDERTPFTIPGGKKIQKYLESAMMPAVLRHDGKIKIPGGININSSTMTAPPLKSSKLNEKSDITVSTSTSYQRNNASLADLSVMSGDVSMYTIMDAQKF